MKLENLGKIITFYSFKGGVGRTMAVANVALLAAMNGKRVLVMDWDLEAPGLFYYFRGLLDRSAGSTTEDGPGVMDFLYEWSDALKKPLNDEEFTLLQSRFGSGAPFSECVKNLIEPAIAEMLLTSGGKLDFIGAGGRTIRCEPPTPYEEILAMFSWPDFFEGKAGGYVLNSLRQWAKANYDLILIDSRTGLADVAGICTMQLPDSVALCFVLNQQNIDGVAKVAASVRLVDGVSINLRAVPMKVARRESADASDAQARALKELTRVGGFSASDALTDFQSLYVALEDNVPFYEALAPFGPVDPALDPLTLAYLRITKELVDTNVTMPVFPAETLKIIRRRLAPSNATIQYIIELDSAEPSRALAEISRLTESAIGTDIDGGSLEPDYVSALFDATVALVQRSDEPAEIWDLQQRLLDLIRRLSRGNPKLWSDSLISAIERSFEMIFLFDKEDEEFSLLDEIDRALESRSEPAYCIKRMTYKRRFARLLLREKKFSDVVVIIDEITNIVETINRQTLTESETHSLYDARIDTRLLSGEVYESTGDVEKAKSYYMSGLDLIDMAAQLGLDNVDLNFNLHFRLASLENGSAAVEHAVKAAGIDSRLYMRNFVSLAKIVLKMSNGHDQDMTFCRVAFSSRMRGSKVRYLSFFGRMPNRALDFMSIVNEFCKRCAAVDCEETQNILATMIVAAAQIGKAISSRLQFSLSKRNGKPLIEVIGSLISIAEDLQLPIDTTRSLEEALGLLRNAMDITANSAKNAN